MSTDPDTTARNVAAWRAAIKTHAAYVARAFEYAADNPPEEVRGGEYGDPADVAHHAAREARFILAGDERMSEAVREMGDPLTDATDGAESAACDAWAASRD